MVTERDVTYLRDGDAALEATLYLPDADAPVPGLVSVHGGAWSTGDRHGNANTSRALAEAGYAVCSLTFRMPPVARYPDCVADVSAGVRWFKAHAPELGVDPARIGGIGYSSGGHQLLLAALRPDDPRYARFPVEGGTDARLAYAITVFGVLDPLARYRSVVERGLTKLVERHHAYWADEAAMAEGNPTLLLGRGEAQDLPPVLAIQGVVDENLTPDMAARFVDAYRAAGGHAELEVYDDAPHAFIKDRPDSPAAVAATQRILAFVAERTAERTSR